MFFVYIIVSEIKGLRFYVGLSEDFDRRLVEHNLGKTKSTKAYVPWKIMFMEKFDKRLDAREREKYWKSGTGKERIKLKWNELNSK